MHSEIVTVSHLLDVPIFGGLPKSVLPSLFDSFVEITLYANEVLFEPRQETEFVYLIAKGRFKLLEELPNGKSSLVYLNGVGDVIGLDAVFTGKTSNYAAVSTGYSRVYGIPTQVIQKLAAQHPDVHRQMFLYLLDIIDVMQYIHTCMANLDVPGRLCALLLHLCERFGAQDGDVILLDHGLTQEELAIMLGATRESVAKGMKFLKDRGWIEYGQGRCAVYTPDKLRERCTIP